MPRPYPRFADKVAQLSLAARMRLPLDELQLSVRSERILRDLGCQTVADIAALSGERELLRQPGCGRVSVSEIKDTLAWVGVYLGMKAKEPWAFDNGHSDYYFWLGKGK